MAVHVPLSDQAQAEARILMLGAQNILNPKDGSPVVTPSQDMVLGNYYLSKEKADAIGEGEAFSSVNEVFKALKTGYVHYHTRVAVLARNFPHKPFTDKQRNQYLITTVGKLLFNEIIPNEIPYLNEPTKDNLENGTPDKYFVDYGTNLKETIAEMPVVPPFKKKYLQQIIAEVFKRFTVTETSEMLDKMKNLGYRMSTISGITFSIADIPVLEDKAEVIEAGHVQVDNINKQYRRGLITDNERYENVIGVWDRVKDDIQEKLSKTLEIDNNIFMMSDSGARGNISNFTQLAGMRGLMASPSGQIMELPVTSSFREGLSVLEMFISTHGARKGMTDTALKTADSGYLTRRLVDVAQEVIVREDDCGTQQGLEVQAIMEGNREIESLEDRIIGRYARYDVENPATGEVLVEENEIITIETARQITAAGIESVWIRSVFNCYSHNGACKKCYGLNLATGSEVEVGEAIGTIAAQSIGEPGTQLTMRTFHTGGVAGADITQGLPRVQEIFEARNPKGKATITEVTGQVVTLVEKPSNNTVEIEIDGVTDNRSYTVPANSRLRVKEGDYIRRGEPLIEGSIDPKELLEVTDSLTTQKYLLQEVQYAYRSQGVEIADKHVEVMVRQMMRKVNILEPGDTDVLPGSTIDIEDFKAIAAKALKAGENPPTARPLILGITRAALETNSFLSAASFQETTKVLTDAAIRSKVDPLAGLKENVIIGKAIPAGTGMNRYRNLEPKEVGLDSVSVYDADENLEEITE